MQTREQMMVGALLLLVGLAVLPAMMIMPLWQEIQQKQTTLTEKKAHVEELQSSIASLQAQVARLKQVQALPEGVAIRTTTETEALATVKDVLDDIVLLANHLGNDLVTLEPAKGSKKGAKASGTSGDENKANDKGSAEKPKGKKKSQKKAKATDSAEPEEPKVQAQSYRYTLVFRGTYSALQALLNAMANYPDLVEVASLELANEGGPARDAIFLGNLKVDKPMRATLTVVVWTMPPLASPPMASMAMPMVAP